MTSYGTIQNLQEGSPWWILTMLLSSGDFKAPSQTWTAKLDHIIGDNKSG